MSGRARVAELVRRAALKTPWPSGHVGSSPTPGIDVARRGSRRARDARRAHVGAARHDTPVGVIRTSRLRVPGQFVESACADTPTVYLAVHARYPRGVSD